ncbi:MAG TPA: hypothetical protein VLM38_02870 [Blastocatellia bacterium]|nr:hypothetical protein [Blastocatellia bacterium]
MEDPAIEKVVPEDWDDFVEFINTHRNEIAEGAYDLRIERDWARDLTDNDLLLLVKHCPSSRLTIATATKSVEVLEFLSGDSSADVREAVADNLRTPTPTLGVLAADSIPAVRMAVAENMNVSPGNLERLSKDEVNYVRWGVAHNERTSADVLALLIKDPDSYVSDEAKRNPNAPKRSFIARLFRKS